jgi:hypothetical protein
MTNDDGGDVGSDRKRELRTATAGLASSTGSGSVGNEDPTETAINFVSSSTLGSGDFVVALATALDWQETDAATSSYIDAATAAAAAASG